MGLFSGLNRVDDIYSPHTDGIVFGAGHKKLLCDNKCIAFRAIEQNFFMK
jgi:hypothetical protein